MYLILLFRLKVVRTEVDIAHRRLKVGCLVDADIGFRTVSVHAPAGHIHLAVDLVESLVVGNVIVDHKRLECYVEDGVRVS